MSWWAVVAHPSDAQHALVSTWLVERSGQAVEERPDGSLVAHAGTEAAADALRTGLAARFQVAATARPVPDIDWAVRWRDGIHPRRFGRLLLVPSWLVGEASHEGPTVILDPESAFGSGEHGSTRGALTLLERHMQPAARVVDLGSGSGILSIGAVVLGARHAIGIEIDAEANAVAERNATRNAVTRTRFLEGDAALLAPLAGPADFVLSNILRTVNVTLLPVIRRTLAAAGTAVFAGMEEIEEPLFRPALAEAGFVVTDEVRDAGWWSVAAQLA